MSERDHVADCLFCKIVAGQVPSEAVAEGKLTYAFRDINPVASVHVLVVPKRHIVNAATVASEDAPDLAEMFLLARAVAEKEEILERGYRLVFNVGKDALNTVGHLHMHVIGGRRLGWPPG